MDPVQFTDDLQKTSDEAEAIIEEAVRLITRAHEDAGVRILARLSVARKSASLVSMKAQNICASLIAKDLKRFAQQSERILRIALTKIVRIGISSAASHIRKTYETTSSSPSSEIIKETAMKVLDDAKWYVLMQCDRMAKAARQTLKEDAMMVFRRSVIAGISRRSAFDLLKGDIRERTPKFGFTDRRGRRWDSRTYFEMLARTVLFNALRDSYVDQLVRSGHDLAIVVPTGSEGNCGKWEGKVVSISGNAEGHATLDEAKSSGDVFHPRCKHMLVVYHPEIEKAFT